MPIRLGQSNTSEALCLRDLNIVVHRWLLARRAAQRHLRFAAGGILHDKEHRALPLGSPLRPRVAHDRRSGPASRPDEDDLKPVRSVLGEVAVRLQQGWGTPLASSSRSARGRLGTVDADAVRLVALPLFPSDRDTRELGV